ncbi:MAG TPA: hypothetical protein VI895_01945, partial [Bdellovibrionota bacterium]|nr:hypothetical protein [Bdellovibrionota bacterium]
MLIVLGWFECVGSVLGFEWGGFVLPPYKRNGGDLEAPHYNSSQGRQDEFKREAVRGRIQDEAGHGVVT